MFKTYVTDFWSLLFPNTCVACQGILVRGEEQICTQCQHNFPTTQLHVYPNNELQERLGSRVSLKHAMAYLKYTKHSGVQKILQSLKYGQNPQLGVLLGRWYAQELSDSGLGQSFDCLVPVPLHPSKLRSRGYNQSACFAEGLAEILKLPYYPHALRRVKATTTQTAKGKLERWENVAGVFEVATPQHIQKKHVLLVDDVVTTGSTLEACIRAIQSVNGTEVSIAAIAVGK